MRVKWLRTALKNLEQAYRFVAEDDPQAAIRLVLKIQLAVDQLTEFPLMGRTGRVAGTRELVIIDPSHQSGASNGANGKR